MMRLVAVLFVTVSLSLAHTSDLVADGLANLLSIERRIAVEPQYKSGRPVYALLVFGREATSMAWAVLDKANAGDAHYNVLYLDRNGNGDLTEPNERIIGKGRDIEYFFDIDTLRDLDSGLEHTEVRLGTLWMGSLVFQMRWHGQQRGYVYCGSIAGTDPAPLPFSMHVDTAPIYWLAQVEPVSITGTGLSVNASSASIAYSPWVIGEKQDVGATIGPRIQAHNIYLPVGLATFDEGSTARATLYYTDVPGAHRQISIDLEQSGPGYSGEFEVPADARPGLGYVRYELIGDGAERVTPFETGVVLLPSEYAKRFREPANELIGSVLQLNGFLAENWRDLLPMPRPADQR